MVLSLLLWRPGRAAKNLLLPAWILGLGLLLCGMPPLDIQTSAAVLVVGVLIIPTVVEWSRAQPDDPLA